MTEPQYFKGELTGRAGVFAIIDNVTYRTTEKAHPHLQRMKLPSHIVYALEKNARGELCVGYIAVDKDFKPGAPKTGFQQAATEPTKAPLGAEEKPQLDIDHQPPIPEHPLEIPGELTIGVTCNIQNYENIRVEFTGEVKTIEDVERMKNQIVDVLMSFGETDLNTYRYVQHFTNRVFQKKTDTEKNSTG